MPTTPTPTTTMLTIITDRRVTGNSTAYSCAKNRGFCQLPNGVLILTVLHKFRTFVTNESKKNSLSSVFVSILQVDKADC